MNSLYNNSIRSINIWAMRIFRFVIILGISYSILYPVLQMISTAFMDPVDIYDITVNWIPKNFTLKNFVAVMSVMEYGKTLTNSLVLAVLTSLLQVISTGMIGYGFARFEFKGRNILFSLVLLTLVIPPQTIIIPLFLNFRFFNPFGIVEALKGSTGILDSYWPFILQSITGMGFKNGLYILIFRQFFKGMPKSLEEAAMVEGLGPIQVFIRVMVPNAVSPIITVFLFSFVWQWNDFYFVSLYLSNTDVLPLALNALAPKIAYLAGDANSLDPYYISLLNNTGALLVIAPPLLLYFFVQRFFVESVERSGLVG